MTDEFAPPPSVTPPPAPSGLIARVIALLTKPAETWDAIAAEAGDIKSIYMGYVVPLAAITPIAAAIGGIVFGHGAFGIMVMGIAAAVVGYILALVMVYVVALIVNALAPSFDGQKNMLNAFKLTAYGMTAGWVGGIFGIVPALGIISLVASIYGLYIIYLGLPKLMKNPKEKTIVYMVVIAVVGFVAAVVIGAVGGMVTGGAALMGGGFGAPHISTNDKVSGTVTIPGVGKMDLDKMQKATEQMAAQASAMENGTASPVKVADPQALLALMPQSFMGAARSDDNASSGGMGGMNASTASARYTLGEGSITLEVSDTGGMAGLGGMANAMGINASSSSAGGYSKVTTDGNRMTSEDYSTDSKSGKYAVVIDGRFAVSADGSNVDMATLKALVNSIDLNKAASLAK